jgi:hypothetical protein
MCIVYVEVATDIVAVCSRAPFDGGIGVDGERRGIGRRTDLPHTLEERPPAAAEFDAPKSGRWSSTCP